MRALSYIPLTLALALGLSACKGEPSDSPTPTPQALTCDSGDAAFVSRLMPLMWGRRAHGAAEVQIWADVAEQHGRDAAALAMAQGPDYQRRWRSWVTDALGVARTGDRAYPGCYSTPMLDAHDGELARALSEADSTGTPYPHAFNMADVIQSALIADDLIVPWRLGLFARMNRPVTGANVGPRELENNRRIAFGDEFYDIWLGRNLTCLPCHNSEFSTTDSDTPETDRAWPIPGLFEQALLGSSFGRDQDSAYAVFRYADLMRGENSTLQPFGMSAACGRFAPQSSLTSDFLGHDAYFIEAFGEEGSVWQVEAYLAEGAQLLRGAGIQGDEGDGLDGPQAFAWLVAMEIVDQVWKEAMGSRLTIATGFPRNQAQRDTLWDLTSTFVTEGYSLRALLVAIAAHPEFNLAPPEVCGAIAYGLQPIYNPWSISEAEADRRMNSPGDQIHRLSARTLISSVHAAMGWAQPSAFLARRDPLLKLQTALGAYMRTSQPGFNGTDFQGSLAFEGTYGACARPQVGGASDGCSETPGFAGCASCTCQDCVCAAEPYCCDVQWDALCVSLCNDSCGGCGGGLASGDDDTIDRLIDAARDSGATVGELSLALKDRLIAQGTASPEEIALIEALLGVGFDTPLAQAPEVEPALRALCGALLLSPDFFLAMDPGPPGPPSPLSLDVAADCRFASEALSAVGFDFDCGEVSH